MVGRKASTDGSVSPSVLNAYNNAHDPFFVAPPITE